MNRLADKDRLIRNFSRYAHLYDKYADVQRLMAYELIKEVPCDGSRSILEIGCGTGNYTRLLRDRFKSAHLKALDISKAMVEIAKDKLQDDGIEFLVGDGELIELDDRYDLITSNAAFQWFDCLEKALANYKDALITNGVIAFSIFGPKTFWELSHTLKEAFENESISSDDFLDKEILAKILRRYFMRVSVREFELKEKHSSLMELLNKIRYTGARGDGSNGYHPWSRRSLERVEDIYKRGFGSIEASYQIFFCRAMR